MAKRRIERQDVITLPVPENISTDSVPDVISSEEVDPIPEPAAPIAPAKEEIVAPAPVASNPPPRG